jgi:hypothetical protein
MRKIFAQCAAGLTDAMSFSGRLFCSAINLRTRQGPFMALAAGAADRSV